MSTSDSSVHDSFAPKSPKSEPSVLAISSLEIVAPKPDDSPVSAVTPKPSTFSHIPEPETTTSPGGLDSLLSPTDPDAHFPLRESIAVSEATDEDSERFSTVMLSSARQSMETLNPVDLSGTPSRKSGNSDSITLSGATIVEENPDLTGQEIVKLVHQNRQHKKTASTSTIVSANNVPFILARLDMQKDQEAEGSNRNSLDGKQKLQEEFHRKHDTESSPTDAEESNPDAIDWNFWGDVVSDYQKFASEHPQDLAKAIERGVPKSLRGMIWQLMSASKDPELEQTYLRLLKEPSPHEKAINRDLGRTFPHHAFFTDGQGIGQENLFNVLKAYSLYDPQVGYCQGLPFVVAILLLNMPDEEAFCLLVRLMQSYGLRGHFLPEMPMLQLRLFQFDRLVEEILPVLHVHFIRQGIKSSMFCSQWFLTMFSYRFPLNIVFRIYDNCLASGIEAIFTFSLILLLKNEEHMLTLKFDQLLAFLNTQVFDIYKIDSEETNADEVRYDVDQFVQDAVSLRITPFMLDSYAHEYEDVVRTREAHAIEMDSLRSTNRTLSSQVQNLESSLSQLNTEHCDILNELVRSRLRNEELEHELVKYKLLYAEAMHQNEDALSSHRLSTGTSYSKRGSGPR